MKNTSVVCGMWHIKTRKYPIRKQRFVFEMYGTGVSSVRVHLKWDGTRWLREGKWRGNWRIEWVASTLHTTSEHGVSSITTADLHTSAASSRMNWRPRQFKWTRPFRRKTKSGFCACAITFETQSTICTTTSRWQFSVGRYNGKEKSIEMKVKQTMRHAAAAQDLNTFPTGDDT